MAGSEWIQVRLGEVCTKIGSGATPRGGSDVYVESGPYALVRSQNVYNDGFHRDGLAYIREQHATELANVEVLKGDVLLNITGDSVARTCQVDPGVLPARVNQHVAIIRPNPDKLDPRFLRYFLVSPEMQSKLMSWAGSGGTRNALTKGMIESFDVLAPEDVSEQRAIAHILGTLDDKIELNRRMNETLEAMVRAIFKSWFVDFDPVRAKVADLIRDGVLEIGDGYRAKNSELGTSGLPFIRAGDLNNGFDTAGAELLTEDSVAKAGSKVCRVGDVAFTSKGTIGRFARVTEHTAKFVYSPQVCYWRSLNPVRLHPAVLYCWMQSDDFKEQITAIAGQTDMAPYVSLQDQRRMSIPIFPKSQCVVASRIEPLLARQSCNAAQTKTLALLRDVLLPKLISGELRVQVTSRLGNTLQ
jgi:type I restriction enzyme S subunit